MAIQEGSVTSQGILQPDGTYRPPLGYFKVGTDVFANTGAGTSQKIDQPTFQQLGINYDLLGEGLQQTKPLGSVRDTETKAFVAGGGVLGQPSAAKTAGYVPPVVPPVTTPTELKTAADTSKEDTVAKLQKAIDDQKAETEKVAGLMKPTERETGLQRELLTATQLQDEMKQGVKERSLADGGTLTGALRSEIENITNGDTRESLVLMRKITQVTQQLSLETAQRQALLEVEKYKADQGQNNITNIRNMFELQREIEKDVLDKAQTLTDNARQTLATILTNFKGLTFDQLDTASAAEITKIANQLGIPLEVLKDGMQVVKNQIDLENRQKDFELQTSRINANNNSSNTSNFKIKDVLTDVQIAKLAASGIDAGVYTAITKALAAGDDLESIRQDLKALGLDPKILDKYDAAVNIASVVKTLQGKGGGVDVTGLIKNYQTTGSITP